MSGAAALLREATKRRSKYGARRTRGFDSKGEAARYDELVLLEKAGAIRDLRTQVTYTLVVNGQQVTTYRADFVYEEGCGRGCQFKHHWHQVVEDFKSPPTRKKEPYRIKRALMFALHGITIREVTRNG